MAKLPFDFKQFRKTAEDKHMTTLTHKDGHTIKLAHQALNPETREALKKIPMSKGGEVGNPKLQEAHKTLDGKNPNLAAGKDLEAHHNKSSPAAYASGGRVKVPGPYVPPPPQWTKEDQDKANTDIANQINQRTLNNLMMPYGGYAQGGKVQHYDEGTPDGGAQPAQQDASPATPAPVTINIAAPNGQQTPIPEQLANPAPGAQQQAISNQTTQPAPNLYGVGPAEREQLLQSQLEQNAKTQEAAKPQPMAEANQPPGMSSMQAHAASGQQPAAQDPYGNEAYLQAYGQGIQEKRMGLGSEAQALGAEGAQQAQALQQQAATQQHIVKNYTDHYQDLDNERKAFQSDYQNQHIDPQHYLNSMGTAGKISTAIGLVLGGMGSAVTHQENPVLKMLNANIDRDIESQKAEMGKKDNLLNANMRQFGNLRDATDMTRVMQSDIIANKLRAAAATAMSPLAQANALKMAGDLDMQSAPVLSQIALRKTMLNSLGDAQNNPAQMGQVIQAMRQMSPEMAKSMEERFVPGVGMAQIPIPREARDTMIAKQALAQMSNDFYKWAQNHTGSIDPKVVNEGKTKAAELQSLYRNSINGGVFKKGEQEFIDNIIDSDPTKFFNNIRVLPKLKEVIRNNDMQLNVLKKGYGLPVTHIQEGAPILPTTERK